MDKNMDRKYLLLLSNIIFFVNFYNFITEINAIKYNVLIISFR